MLQKSLKNTTVVDFTQIGAGPTCTMYLGDLGARVIKIEPPKGDIGRALGPPWHRENSAIYAAFNRNKQSIGLDLSNEEGKRVALKLIEKADVVVESFRPGVMGRLGLDYPVVRKLKPDVVYCSVSAYGQDGPYAGHAGVDGIIQAASGLMSLIGFEGGEPCKVQAPIVDVATGYLATIAVLAGLHHRAMTGEGMFLDASLFSSAIALQQSSITGYLADHAVPLKLGSAAPYSAPNEAFRTSDGWIMVAAYSPERWLALCKKVLGAAELAEIPELATSSDRVEHRGMLRRVLSPFFEKHTTAEWVKRLEAEDILCSPVNDYASLLGHPQLKERGILVEMQPPRPGGPMLSMPGFPVRTPQAGHRYKYPPALSEHADEILAWAGYGPDQIDCLYANGVVGRHVPLRAGNTGE